MTAACSCSARSPFVTLLSRRAQSGTRTSYQETGVVHRITYSFSYFLFYLCFIYLFYSWYKIMERCIQLSNQIISRKITQSLLCTPTYTTLIRDCFHTGLLASVISSQPFRRLNLSPIQLLLPTTNGSEYTLTDQTQNVRLWTVRNWRASKPKKLIYQKCLAAMLNLFFGLDTFASDPEEHAFSIFISEVTRVRYICSWTPGPTSSPYSRLSCRWTLHVPPKRRQHSSSQTVPTDNSKLNMKN